MNPYDDKKKGDEVILTPSELSMWKKFVKILKMIREKPITVIK